MRNSIRRTPTLVIECLWCDSVISITEGDALVVDTAASVCERCQTQTVERWAA